MVFLIIVALLISGWTKRSFIQRIKIINPVLIFQRIVRTIYILSFLKTDGLTITLLKAGGALILAKTKL